MQLTELTSSAELVKESLAVETEKLVEYWYSTANEATESAKVVTNGLRNMLVKLLNLDEYENVNENEDNNNSSNPLLVDLVVRNIISFLDTLDLCNCRLVCRLWNFEAGVVFRRSQRIIFYPESSEKMAALTAQARRERDMQSLSLSLSPSPSSCFNYRYPRRLPPFSSFCFTAQFPSTQFPTESLREFLSVCGSDVKRLEVFYPNDGVLNASDFLRFLVGMPNVESIHFINLPLSLTQQPFLQGDNSGSEPQSEPQPQPLLSSVTQLRIDRTWQIDTTWKGAFLKDLLSLMPNLHDYEVWTWNSTEDEHSKAYFMSLSPDQVGQLQVLRPGSIGADLGYSLATFGLKLKKLFLPVLNSSVGAEVIEALLSSQRETLEEFQVNCSSRQMTKFLQFPSMTRLETLHLTVTQPWNNEYIPFSPPVDYRAQFPVLRKLRLELALYVDLAFVNFFFPPPRGIEGSSLNTYTNNNCPTLRELDLSFSGFRDETFMSTIARLFPSLKVFRLDGYGMRIFSNLCLELPQLEGLSLWLIYGFNVDDQLTGIDKPTCNALRKVLSENGKPGTSAGIQDSREPERAFASLSSLTKLRRLTIKQKDYQAKFFPESQCVTQVSVAYALVQMKQLRYLSIDSVKMPSTCREILSAALPDCCLDFV